MTSTSRRQRPAFTIVELLVVLGIIGVLAGLLLPALGGARRKARKTEEINRIRQVGVAFTLYSSSNDDKALPGFLPEDVQETWRVRSKYPDGQAVPREYSESYPWRLAAYLDYDPQVLLGYRNLDSDSKLDLQNESIEDQPISDSDVFEYLQTTTRPETFALQPAFGYNAYHIGGWWEVDPGDPDARPTRRFDQARTFPGDRRTNVISKSPSSIRNSTRIVVFCSSTLANQRLARAVDNRPGAHFVSPPTLAMEVAWSRAEFGANDESSDTIIDVAPDLPSNAAPLGRYTGQVAILHADMHTTTEQPGALDDQRRWIDVADRREFVFTEE